MEDMTSQKPYLLRALYEWIADNNMTPYMMVDANLEGVVVPQQFVDDGRIVLNVSMTAVRDLQLDNEMVFFNARFSGKAMDVIVPMDAVLAIYAQENGQGMAFPQVDPELAAQADVTSDEGPEDDPDPQPPRRGRPNLSVVK